MLRNIDPLKLNGASNKIDPKTLELLNTLQEQIFSVGEKIDISVDTLSSDIARLIINMVALSNILLDNKIISKEQFTEYLKNAAEQFRQSFITPLETENKEDELKDIQI